jgi:putative spermidine/putrescine transport system permease protein
MSRARFGVSLFGVAALLVLLWPLGYATWVSFAPGEMLEPPIGDWSLRWYRAFFASPQWTRGLVNSGIVAGQTVLGSLLGGTGVAVAVTRGRFRGAGLLSGAVMLPLFVPAVVLGMALLPFMRALGLWGTHVGIAAAHSLWSLPIVFLMVRSALAELDPDLERAARGLGARPLTVFARVTVPLIAPAVAAAAMMAFILSLNEFVMALFLGTPSTETLPKVIWPNLRYTLTPLVAAASGVSTAVTWAGLLAGAFLFRRRRSEASLSLQENLAPRRREPYRFWKTTLTGLSRKLYTATIR